jgi:hypothetical protein
MAVAEASLMGRAGWLHVLISLLLLSGSLAGPAMLRLTPLGLLGISGTVLANPDDDDDDDDEEEDEEEDEDDDDKEERPPQQEPSGLEVFRSLKREVALGTIWVVQLGNRQHALRVSLEFQGQTIGAITLNPKTGQPVPYEARNISLNMPPLTQAQLRTYLNTLRSQASQLSVSTFGLPTASGVQFPVYWNNRLVTYVRFNPAQGVVLPDTNLYNEIRTSPLRLR